MLTNQDISWVISHTERRYTYREEVHAARWPFNMIFKKGREREERHDLYSAGNCKRRFGSLVMRNSCCWKKASVLNSPSPLISCMSRQVRYLVHCKLQPCRLSDRVCRFQLSLCRRLHTSEQLSLLFQRKGLQIFSKKTFLSSSLVDFLWGFVG
jgi:hypothetical protein